MKNIIKKLLREGLINEDITSGAFTIYHRTDYVDIFKFKQGYKPSTHFGARFGVGLYAFCDLNDVLKTESKLNHGKTILEFKINSNLNNFLILDNNEAKKIYGSNHSILNQLKKIFDGGFNKFYLSNKEELLNILKLESDIQNPKIQEEILDKIRRLTNFNDYVYGVILTDTLNGKIIVVYKLDLAKPIRFSNDNGQTWVNIKTKQDKIIDLINNPNITKNWSIGDINALIYHSDNKEETIESIINNDFLFSRLGYKNGLSINEFLSKLKNPQLLINKLITSNDFIRDIEIPDIYALLEYTNNPNQILMLINDDLKIKFYDSLKAHSFGNYRELIYKSKNKEELINLLKQYVYS